MSTIYITDKMGKKGKKKGKGSGKKSGGKKSGKSTATQKKAHEPQMTIREAIVAYQ